jgi:hypothetical protein
MVLAIFFLSKYGIGDMQGYGRGSSRAAHDNSDNHIGFCDLFILWCRLVFSRNVDNCGICDRQGCGRGCSRTIHDNSIKLTTMLFSVTCLFYGGGPFLA